MELCVLFSSLRGTPEVEEGRDPSRGVTLGGVGVGWILPSRLGGKGGAGLTRRVVVGSQVVPGTLGPGTLFDLRRCVSVTGGGVEDRGSGGVPVLYPEYGPRPGLHPRRRSPVLGYPGIVVHLGPGVTWTGVGP